MSYWNDESFCRRFGFAKFCDITSVSFAPETPLYEGLLPHIISSFIYFLSCKFALAEYGLIHLIYVNYLIFKHPF